MKILSLKDAIAQWFISQWVCISVFIRFALGGWFVWRKSPDWLVQWIARDGESAGKDDENWNRLVQEAQDEWKLRKRRRNANRKINERCKCGARTCICEINELLESVRSK